MNKLFLFLFNSFIPFFAFAQVNERLNNAKSGINNLIQSVAVIELFSSEGCSSCPSADDMINKIAIDAGKKHLPIYVLEEHVDYLNNTEWKDTFSGKQFTDRQKNYKQALHDDNIYTPQIFVNGPHEVYVPNAEMVTEEINKALKEPALTTISFSVNPVNDSIAEVDYHLSTSDKNWIVNFVLVQKNAVTHITSGENKGLTLTHLNVAKQIVSDSVSIPDGIVQLNIPKYEVNTFSVIAFIQDKITMKIIGATQMNI